MCDFWKRVLDAKPDLVGSSCYFSPTAKTNLKLLIRDDGTVSPAQRPELRCVTVDQLVQLWRSGDIVGDNGSALSTRIKTSKLTFSDDCFFCAGRRQRLRTIFKAQHPPSSIVNSSNDCSVSPVPDGETVESNIPITAAVSDCRTKKCPGLQLEKHLPAIQVRKWDGDRMPFSPVTIEGDICRSKTCEQDIALYRRLCFQCTLARKRLWDSRRYLKPTSSANETRRITYTPNIWLTAEEMATKRTILVKEKEKALRQLRTKAKQVDGLQKRLRDFRPEEKVNRRAIRSAVKLLNMEDSKIKSPTCEWLTNGSICGYKATSVITLSRHLREIHYSPQLKANKSARLRKREYCCCWKNCRRRSAFETFQELRRHVIRHSGNRKSEDRLNMLREQLINCSREPTGRRYGKTTVRCVLRQYKSQRTWNRTLDACTLPMPSVRTVLTWKNDGEIKSGIDWTVLKMMEKIRKSLPHLGHGIISIDEIYVNKKKQLAPNGDNEFGMADNRPTELAGTVLVFQYVALFSTQRYVINVAWYGCSRLDAKQLEIWLWQVMLALKRYGYVVHALVSDGAAINRGMQRKLVSDAKKIDPSRCQDYAIPHPQTTDSETLLFIFSDPSHILKRFRNCWFNRQMEFIGAFNIRYPIKWTDLLDVYEWQQRYRRVDRKLTDKHIDMSNYNKMNVRTAVDVFSKPIADVMTEINAANTAGTRDYMELAREFWRRMNDNRMYLNESEARASLDAFMKIAADLKAWHKRTVNEPDKFLTSETYADALLVCEGMPAFMRYIWDVLAKTIPNVGCIPRVISQDPLENTFGTLRQRGGGTQHITVLTLAYNLRTINCNMINEFMQ